MPRDPSTLLPVLVCIGVAFLLVTDWKRLRQPRPAWLRLVRVLRFACTVAAVGALVAKAPIDWRLGAGPFLGVDTTTWLVLGVPFVLATLILAFVPTAPEQVGPAAGTPKD